MGYIGKQPTPVPLSASDLDDDIISLAKLAGGTDGNVISYDASGDPVAIATGNDGQVLTSAGAGQPCAFEAAAGGSWTKITTVTASSDSTIEFVNGAASVTLDGTYKQYRINIINVHPSASGTYFQVNFTSDAGSNWNVTKTSAPLYSYLKEDASSYTNYATHEYNVDTTSGTGVAYLSASKAMGNDNEDNLSGELKIWNPADTTYHKFFSSECMWIDDTGTEFLGHCMVYAKLETTSAVDGIQFKMSTGNIDAGTFILYGLT